mmetsp:Transcript_38591/g.69174  ORF Transcript_38591/g.69174 Transcript_38591/m.69174 type:complete len:210 (-) Transcript_38591:291-920(-)
MPAVERLTSKIEFSCDPGVGELEPEAEPGVSLPGPKMSGKGRILLREASRLERSSVWPLLLLEMCKSSKDMVFSSPFAKNGAVDSFGRIPSAELLWESPSCWWWSSKEAERLWRREAVRVDAPLDSLLRVERPREARRTSRDATAGLRLILGLESVLRMYSFWSARWSFLKWVDLRKWVEMSLATRAARKVAKAAKAAQVVIFMMTLVI